MSDDWQPGDLALCVRGATYTRAGRLYTVSEVLVGGMYFVGLPTNLRPGRFSRFRKIRPHTPDAEDAETIRLLTGAPVREPVA